MNNAAPINGGAINVQGGGTATVVKITLTRNRSGSLGGAVSNLGNVKVTRSTLLFNRGSAGGVIATSNINAVTLVVTTMADNMSDSCNPAN